MTSPRHNRSCSALHTSTRDDRGSSAIELVLITPVLIALVFGLIQTALVWNAHHTVGSAAQHGARVARTATALAPDINASTNLTSSPGQDTGGDTSQYASEAEIRSSTLAFLKQTGGAALRNPTVTISRVGSYVTVTVSGTTVGVLPGTSVNVSGSSRTPLEGFRP